MASVLTVILNWRTPDMTLDAAAAAVRAMDGIDGAITIVDNDSGDGSEDRLRSAVASRGWDRVRVMQAGRNGGFGAGNNVGIRAGLPDGARPDFVYILNSDAFPAHDAIARLLAHMQAHPEAGFAGSYIHGPEGDAHITLFRFPTIGSEFEGAVRFGPVSRLLAHRIVPLPVPPETTRVDWVAGASVLIRQDVLDRIGLFDEGYFLYYEETDLCLRAARAGYATDYVRDSHVAHIGSVSTGMKTWRRVPGYWFDSRWRYFAKNHGRVYAAVATMVHFGGAVFAATRAVLTGRRRAFPPHYLRDLVTHMIRTGWRMAAPDRGTSGTRPIRSES